MVQHMIVVSRPAHRIAQKTLVCVFEYYYYLVLTVGILIVQIL